MLGALFALAGLATVNAIPTISVKGTKFFTSEGDQFFVKGESPYSTRLLYTSLAYLPQIVADQTRNRLPTRAR